MVGILLLLVNLNLSLPIAVSTHTLPKSIRKRSKPIIYIAAGVPTMDIARMNRGIGISMKTIKPTAKLLRNSFVEPVICSCTLYVLTGEMLINMNPTRRKERKLIVKERALFSHVVSIPKEVVSSISTPWDSAILFNLFES
jgi:hypothetical protein